MLEVRHIDALSPNKSDGQSDSPRPTTNELSKKMPGRPPELETGFRPGTHEKQQSHRERTPSITHSCGTLTDADYSDTVCFEQLLARGARHREGTLHALTPYHPLLRNGNRSDCADTVCLEKVLERGARHCEETLHALSPSFAPVRPQDARITLASLMAKRPYD